MLVGIVNTILGAAIMFILYNLAGCSYWTASAANYIIVSILSFFLNKFFTFGSTDASASQILRFVANIAVCYVLAYTLAEKAVRLALSFLDPMIAGNIALGTGLCLFTACNYLGQRFIVFRKNEESE